jgi:hypothetical protein
LHLDFPRSANIWDIFAVVNITHNYKLIINYYETAHAKGPQDAAGGFLKSQADYAVLRGKATIQCAKDLYKFVEENLQQPKCKNGKYKRRIFRYVESIPRDNNRNFKPLRTLGMCRFIIISNQFTMKMSRVRTGFFSL